MSQGEKRSLTLLAAALVLLLAGLWLVGALSGALFGAGWSPVAGAEMPRVGVRLISHLGDPASAWPPGAAGRLPDAAGFYATALLLAAVGAGIVAAASRFAGFDPIAELFGGEDKRRAPAARWARRRDLKDLIVRPPQPTRLVLGHSGRSTLAAENRHSVLAIAPTDSFKTTGLAIPALLEWEGPVVGVSVKNDLVADTLARRQSLGEVMIFDPAQVTGLPTSRATPLWGAGTWRGAMRVAHWLCGAAKLGSAGGLQDADFWFKTAEKLLAPLLYAAATNGHTMESVVRWLDIGDASEEEVGKLLTETGTPEALRAYMASQNREERQRSSVYTTAELVVTAFSDPKVIEETQAADYSPATLLDGHSNSLFLCAPLHEQARLQSVFSMLLQEILAVVYETVAVTEKPLDPPLLVVIDEGANIAPIPNHAEIASTAASQGVQLVSIFQDYAQVKTIHGPRAATIVNNHRALIVGGGISDPETLNLVSGIVGAGEFEQRSRTAGERGRQSTTEGDTYRDLLPANVLRGAELGTGVLVYGHLPPTRIRFRPWFRDSQLRKLRDAAAVGSDAQEV
jgi:type IV secretion system protein VirD4